MKANSTLRSVVLIGPPGSGKTSAGQMLAERWQCPFHDTDRLIEQRCGKTVSAIFAENGEAHFRTLESLLLDELGDARTVDAPIVLATGGGIAVTPGNYEKLARIGTVVCLRAAAETLAERLFEDKTRPLLADSASSQSPFESLKVRLQELLKVRAEAYGRALLSVDTSGLEPSEVAIEVEKVIRETKQSQ